MESFNAKVNEIVYLPAGSPDSAMVEILVRIETGSFPVRLGPAAFLKEHGLIVREGDSVHITGFAVTGIDGDLFVATEISKDATHLTLRDSRGRSAWGDGQR